MKRNRNFSLTQMGFFIWSLIFLACGIKKPPEPPEKLFPVLIKELRVMIREGCVELSWEYPGQLVPEKFQIQRIEQNRLANGLEETEQNFFVSGKDNYYLDCALKVGRIYGYRIGGISKLGFSGEMSQTVWIYLPWFPSPPENFQARSGDKFIDLSWKAQPDLAYNLYCSQEGGKFSGKPINPVPIREGKYSDGNLENGREYHYCLRAVILQKEYPPIESECSLVSATPIDLIAPARPRGLVLSLTQKGVWLKWFKSPEPDLLGYLVYRRRLGEKSWTQITREPLPEPEYLDAEALQLKGRFEYSISARDNAPTRNESPLSQPERIFIP